MSQRVGLPVAMLTVLLIWTALGAARPALADCGCSAAASTLPAVAAWEPASAVGPRVILTEAPAASTPSTAAAPVPSSSAPSGGSTAEPYTVAYGSSGCGSCGVPAPCCMPMPCCMPTTCCGSCACGPVCGSSCGGDCLGGGCAAGGCGAAGCAPNAAPSAPTNPAPANNQAPPPPTYKPPTSTPSPSDKPAPSGTAPINPTSFQRVTAAEPVPAAKQSGATFVVWVPAHASVTINGRPTTSLGMMRTYHSPDVAPGNTYEFKFHAEEVRDGKLMKEDQTVRVQAGDEKQLTFWLSGFSNLLMPSNP